MKRTITVLTLFALLLALSFPVEAYQQAKVAKIGWLRARPGASPRGASEGIRRTLHELGYVEGKNIAFEYRYTEGKLDRIPALADELVRLRVDVLVASSTAETEAFKNATRTIPIVFYLSSDPVADGLVDSLARPGSNITGFSTISPVLAGKRLELLKEAIARLSRVAVLWDPQNPSSMQQWKESQLTARRLGLQLFSLEVSKPDKFEGAFKEATKERSTALAITRSEERRVGKAQR